MIREKLSAMMLTCSQHVTAVVMAGAAVVLIGGGTTAGLVLTSSSPDVAACKSAMTVQYRQALSSGKQGTEPPACKGISPATLARLVTEITASVPPGNAAACRSYVSARNYLQSATTITAATVLHVTEGIQSAELLASGKLQSDLADLESAIETGTSGEVIAASSLVDRDCQ